jgi:ethanolamine ammonia-lyase small subunit
VSEADPWEALRRFTPARIALGRAGSAQTTRASLDFALSHARARDAVRTALDVDAVEVAIAALGFRVLRVTSAAPDRATYLARPDLGRRLSRASRALLAATKGALPEDPPGDGRPRRSHDEDYPEDATRNTDARRAPPHHGREELSATPASRHSIDDDDGSSQESSQDGERAPPFDLAIVVGDGLSSPAVERNAVPLLAAFLPWIAAAGWQVAPVVLATQARVALGDEVAASLGASAVLTLIGERPGLSAPDSLGAYLTFAPVPGVTKDAGRNCLSNIRDGGMSHDQAAFRIAWLLAEALRRRLTGIALKDESDRLIVQGRLPEPRLLPAKPVP